MNIRNILSQYIKNTSSAILCSLLLLVIYSSSAIASDITINGSADFKCSFGSSYMKKHGYSFIEETLHNNTIKANIFGAKDAEVTIKNNNNAVVGTGKTDIAGGFSISVPEEASYQIIVKFHDKEISSSISDMDEKYVKAHFGYFSTDKVGFWIDSNLDW